MEIQDRQHIASASIQRGIAIDVNLRVSQNWGTFLGVFITRTIVYWGLYKGPPSEGDLRETGRLPLLMSKQHMLVLG